MRATFNVSPPHFLHPLLKKTDARLGLFVVGRPAPIATTVESAFDSASRRRGLLGRDSLDPATALVIAPSGMVHTFRMRFPIGAIFAARDGRVLKVRDHLVAGRIAGTLGAFATIEFAADVVTKLGVKRGDRLEVRTLE